MVHLGLSILLGVLESLTVEYVGIWSGDSHHLSSVSQHVETEELGDKHLPDTQFLHQVHLELSYLQNFLSVPPHDPKIMEFHAPLQVETLSLQVPDLLSLPLLLLPLL